MTNIKTIVLDLPDLLLDPNNSDIYFNLGKSYFENSKLIQAREAFTRTIGLDPRHGSAYYYQGIINENMFKYSLKNYGDCINFGAEDNMFEKYCNL